MFFTPCRQIWTPPQTRYGMSLAVRAAGAPADVESAVRRELEAMDKQAVFQVSSLEELVARSTQHESILAAIATGFGMFTLVLTSLGLYALIDLTVAARRHELGIRMALGADGRSILLLLLKDVARIFALGAGLGCAATLVVARIYQAFLYGTADLNPVLLSGAAAIVLSFALAAALVPARRAARLQPGDILKKW